MRRVIFVTIGLMLGGLGIISPGMLRTYADNLTIEAGNLYFCDASYQEGICERTVDAGDTVTWSNIAGFHTVTECDDNFSICPPAGGFDSGNLVTGNSFSHAFNSPGVFAYYCMFHPTDMRGRITVLAAPTATPSPTAAPTTAPSGSAAPTLAPTTASPVSVPRTGGSVDSDGPAEDATLALVAGGVLLLGAAAAGAWIAGRERH